MPSLVAIGTVNRPGFSGGRFFRQRLLSGLVVTVGRLLGFERGLVINRGVEPVLVEPVHP